LRFVAGHAQRRGLLDTRGVGQDVVGVVGELDGGFGPGADKIKRHRNGVRVVGAAQASHGVDIAGRGGRGLGE